MSWFIGPKSENSSTFEDLLKLIIFDYFHWRKNYFPEDPLLITKSDQHSFDEENDKMYQHVHEFLAALRRNFPFYNPRYIAHMLSDVTMPSLLGYFGGMLYNPNNVTPEAAPVTAEWEIEACNDIVKMLGYKPAPVPPKTTKEEDWKNYQRELSSEFGWAHIASGGTLANIEALWVARCAKYLPISIKDVVLNKLHDVDIELKMANGQIVSIKNIDNFKLINIKPSEAIYLLSKYIQTYVCAHSEMDVQCASREAMEILNSSEYSIANNIGKLLTEYPLAIFVSGTAHYSVHKAADLLGIGRNNIKFIEINSNFKINENNLKCQIQECIKNGISPLAVIGIAGTTEEGAVDPIDKIIDIRKSFEEDDNVSFWVHVDSAWGGYTKTILEMDEEQECRMVINKIYNNIVNKDEKKYFSLEECFDKIAAEILNKINGQKRRVLELDKIYQGKKRIETYYNGLKKDIHTLDCIKKDLSTPTTIKNFINSSNVKYKLDTDGDNNLIEFLLSAAKEKKYKLCKNKLDEFLKEKEDEKTKIKPYIYYLREKHYFEPKIEEIRCMIKDKNYGSVIREFKSLGQRLYELLNGESLRKLSKDAEELNASYKITIDDRAKELGFYTKNDIEIIYKKSIEKYKINIEDKSLVTAFLAFKNADSITIDPHKQGYMPYPCGVIAFKNDRIRHLITQEAPYITSSIHNALLHNPPLHIKDIDFNNSSSYESHNPNISAFAPFILEGSKPGAAAASLWLTNKCIPLNSNGYGSIIRNTLLATKEFYMWINRWKTLLNNMQESVNYEFLPISNCPPDLNVFVFVIKQKNANSLREMNKLTNSIYQKYSIQAEFGDKKYSYGQPFFLSKTSFSLPHYNFSAFSDFFKKNGFSKEVEQEYKSEGMVVLRATLMNPYILVYEKNKGLNLIQEFVLSLHKEANKLTTIN